jgi:Raf kinase inhibitor-like YbhB/YbcL family protein
MTARVGGTTVGRAMAIAAMAVLGACEPSAPPGTAIETLTVTSDSFPQNGPIPVDETCDGANRSPPITWSAPPRGTRSFAVVAEDPDASNGTFTHWILYDISAEARALGEGADPSTVGGASGLNDFKRAGYGGPCPPQFELHHYSFRVYALNAPLGTGHEPTRATLDAAMNGHVLATGAVVGVFSH